MATTTLSQKNLPLEQNMANATYSYSSIICSTTYNFQITFFYK